MVKTVRIKILKPLEPIDDWKDFKKIIKTLQEEVRVASNKVMTACNIKYSEIQYGADMKEALKGFDSQLYYIAKENAPSLYVNNAQQISKGIYKRYFTGKNSYIRMMYKGDGNTPMSHKKEMPIPICKLKSYFGSKKDGTRGSKVDIDMNEYGRTEIKVSLISPSFKKEWNESYPENLIKSGFFKFAIDTKPKYIRSIVERLISMEYNPLTAKIIKKDSDYFIDITYEMTPQNTIDNIIPSRIMGVDLGIKYAAVCAIPELPERKKFINGAKIIEHCNKIEAKRRKLQRISKYEPNDGHGRNPKVRQSNSIRNKQSNYHSTVNRKFAKDIIDFALDNNCGIIRMEELSGFRSKYCKDKFLGKWTYYQLQEYISQKAEANGIKVEFVDPKNTSRKCSVCGHTSETNRKSQAEFICEKCGFKANADYNASINIANLKPIK